MTTDPPSATPHTPVHWVVRMNRRNRSIFCALLFVSLGAHLHRTGAGPTAWAGLALSFLAYPQLAYWYASRSTQQRRAEMRNLLFDAVVCGLWSGGLGLPVWISFTVFTGCSITTIVFHGYPGLRRMLPVMGGTALLAWAWSGAPLHPDTDALTTALCIVTLTLYFAFFAHDGYTRAMEQHHSHQTLRRQLEEIRALQARLHEIAVRDPLTGLLNRRQLITSLEHLLAQCQARQAALSLLMIDIDHFKHINDAHGHAAGDLTLQTLAELLARHVHGPHKAFRYGGEEFLLLLADCAPSAALAHADALRRAFASLALRLEGREWRATLSCGVAGFPANAGTPQALLACADRALYAAKQRGRNCVVADEPQRAAVP